MIKIDNWRSHIVPITWILLMSVAIFYVFHKLDPYLNFEEYLISKVPIILPEYKVV